MRWMAVLALAACGTDDPCDGVAGTCATLRVESSAVEAIDQLELDLLYNGVHATRASQPTGGGTVEFPLLVGVELAVSGEVDLGVVGAGKLGGTVLGTGSVRDPAIPAGSHVALTLTIAAPTSPACMPGGFYCGSNKLSGDSDTLYKCNGDGVPLARAVCKIRCVDNSPKDDGCLDIDLPCVEPGLYCGGDKVVGDPRSLYRCTGGVGVRIMECPNGCQVNASPKDDGCK